MQSFSVDDAVLTYSSFVLLAVYLPGLARWLPACLPAFSLDGIVRLSVHFRRSTVLTVEADRRLIHDSMSLNASNVFPGRTGYVLVGGPFSPLIARRTEPYQNPCMKVFVARGQRPLPLLGSYGLQVLNKHVVVYFNCRPLRQKCAVITVEYARQCNE
jgi:hypothetical protein